MRFFAPVAAVAGVLLAAPVAFPHETLVAQTQAPRVLSAFDRRKAEDLLHSKLPCLGCHQLHGVGGRLGPDLAIAARLSARDAYTMITDPQRAVPGTMMPHVPMDPKTVDLIAGYLLQPPPGERSPASRLPLPSGATRSTTDNATSPAAVYGKFCAPCHGTRGGGDGPNARSLPVAPTAHASKAVMSLRSDDALFDTIFAGGYIMNRSNFMPPFGLTLTREQIWGLVRYIRSLCGCRGPAWSSSHS